MRLELLALVVMLVPSNAALGQPPYIHSQGHEEVDVKFVIYGRDWRPVTNAEGMYLFKPAGLVGHDTRRGEHAWTTRRFKTNDKGEAVVKFVFRFSRYSYADDSIEPTILRYDQGHTFIRAEDQWFECKPLRYTGKDAKFFIQPKTSLR